MTKTLPIIVIAQFFCTSVWFAGNAIMGDMATKFQLPPSYLSYLISMVQLGFILGTLVFAIFNISDRFSPSKVFFICATAAAVINFGIVWQGIDISTIMLIRFLTGFFLAGIYPVGMKIAADYTETSLGKSLGFLVGALVLGTSFPHFIKSISHLSWQNVIYCTSLLSFIGGLAILLLVPDGPFRKKSQHFRIHSFVRCFSNKNFREAAFGYFGHMWELYAFWAFIPLLLAAYQHQHPAVHNNISLLSFFIIAIGCLACIFSGILAQYFGTKRIASIALTLSGCCCLLSPFALIFASDTIFIIFLLFWGIVVVADSPLFSALVAQHAIAELKGTSLTIVVCIGFAITIGSIQLISAFLAPANEVYLFMVLALGPILGILAFRPQKT